MEVFFLSSVYMFVTKLLFCCAVDKQIYLVHVVTAGPYAAVVSAPQPKQDRRKLPHGEFHRHLVAGQQQHTNLTIMRQTLST